MVRETIVDDIVTTLGTIATSSGYNNDIGLVTRKQLNWGQLKPNQLPAAMVVWVTDEKESDGANYQHIWSTLRVVIRGEVYAKTDLEGALNDFTEDIEKAMTVDGTRSNNAVYTIPVRVQAYEIMNDYYQLFDFEFDVVYQYIYGTP